MKNIYKIIVLLTVSVFLFTGCVTSNFESVLPPSQDYPTVDEYEFDEAFAGNLIVSKSFYGNKSGNTLYVVSDSSTISDFNVGDTGTVTYSNANGTVSVSGVLTQCPQNGSGTFVVEHEEVSDIADKFPGRFSVTVAEYKNCLMISKEAVYILDDQGNALVKKLDENGILYDVPITVGANNSSYYQVLSGLEEEESVVVKND